MVKEKLGKWSFILIIIAVVFLLNSTVLFADSSEVTSELKVGDIIGTFKQSDTKVHIDINCNQYNFYNDFKYIPTYAVDNELCIIVEDLVYYGYKAIWNPQNRTTRLFIDGNPKYTKGTKRVIKPYGYIYYTDIKIYVDGHEIPAYNINGYSLVKLSDLINITGNVRFKKVLGKNQILSIRGKIELPDGEEAQEGGLIVTPVFYFFNNGRLDKYVGNKYVIPEGESSVDYRIQLPVYQYWNKMGYENPYIYNFIGYEINSDTDRYIKYDMTYTTDINPLYLQKLNYYQDKYDNVNIEILKKQNVKVALELTGDVFDIFKDEWIREIHVTAIDTESNKYITKEERFSCRQNTFEFDFDLIKNRKYKFSYKITIFGSFSSGMPLPPSSQYPAFFYSSGGGERDADKAEVIEINKQTSNIIAKITLPDIIIGNVYEAEKRIIYNTQEIKGYIVNGKYLINSKDIEGYGQSAYWVGNFDTFTDKDDKSLDIQEKSLGKLLISNWWIHDDKENRIPVYYFYNGNTLEKLVLINDLEEIGFEIEYYDDAIEINLLENK